MLQPRQWFEDRWRVFFSLALGRPAAKVVLWLYFLASGWDLFGAQFLSKELADKLPTVYDVAIMTGGFLPWYWWTIIGLVLLLGIVCEFSIRQQKLRSTGKAQPIVAHITTLPATGTAKPPSIWFRIRRFWQIWADKRVARKNPGNGWRVVRAIMNASTTEEIEAFYKDFKNAQHRTSEMDVFAAQALKKRRLSGKLHLPSNNPDEVDWLWDLAEDALEGNRSNGGVW